MKKKKKKCLHWSSIVVLIKKNQNEILFRLKKKKFRRKINSFISYINAVQEVGYLRRSWQARLPKISWPKFMCITFFFLLLFFSKRNFWEKSTSRPDLVNTQGDLVLAKRLYGRRRRSHRARGFKKKNYLKKITTTAQRDIFFCLSLSRLRR